MVRTKITIPRRNMKAIICPKKGQMRCSYTRIITQPHAKLYQKVIIHNTIQSGRIIDRKMSDVQLIQLNSNGIEKTCDDNINYYRRGINPSRDVKSKELLSRQEVMVGDVVEVIIPKNWYTNFADKFYQKKIFGVIDYIDADNQKEHGIKLIIKFHKRHKSMKKIKGKERYLNNEWIVTKLTNVKFVRRGLGEGKDYVGSLHDTDTYYESLGYKTLPPHELDKFLIEWGDIKTFFHLKK